MEDPIVIHNGNDTDGSGQQRYVYRCARIKINEMLTSMRHTIRIMWIRGKHSAGELFNTNTHRNQSDFLLSFSLFRCVCVYVSLSVLMPFHLPAFILIPTLKVYRSDCDVHKTNEFHSDKHTYECEDECLFILVECE